MFGKCKLIECLAAMAGAPGRAGHLAGAGVLMLAFSSASTAQTLEEAFVRAYETNPALAAQRAGQAALDEAVPQALAGLRPSITVTAKTGFTQSRLNPGDLDNRSPRGVGVSLTVPLFDGFQTQNRGREADANVRAGLYALDDAEQNMFSEIAGAYGDVVRDRRVAALQRQNVGFLKRQLYSTTRRQALGDLSRTDVAQARSRLNQAKAAASQAQATLAGSQANFLQLVGTEPGQLAAAPKVWSRLPATLEVALQLADQNNPAILRAIETARAARHNVAAQKGALLPSVSVQAKYDLNEQTSSSYDWSDERSVMLNVSVPLYAGGVNYSRIRQAAAQAMQRELELEDLRRKTVSTVTALWRNWQAARQRITLARNTLAAAKTAVTGVKVEAKVGQRSVIDVLDAQRERVFAEIELERSRRDALVYSFQLLAAIGDGTANRLGLPVPLYDTQANLRRVRTGLAGLSGIGLE